jgi:Icc-related predicted phosphoesterase
MIIIVKPVDIDNQQYLISATSDLHGRLPVIDRCDMLIIAGDICPDGSIEQQSRWLNNEFRIWLNQLPVTVVVAIAGNHDFALAEKSFDLPWIYLENQVIEFADLIIYGSPLSPAFWGVFQASKQDLIEEYSKIPEQADIVISHGPPYQYGDKIYTGEHVGSPELRKKIKQSNYGWVINGHIHEDYGRLRTVNKTGKETIISNVSLGDNQLLHPAQKMYFDRKQRKFDGLPFK